MPSFERGASRNDKWHTRGTYPSATIAQRREVHHMKHILVNAVEQFLNPLWKW